MREIYLDSRNRISSSFGNAYTLYLQTPMKNISQVDLVAATVPNTMYNITNGSNIFSVSGTDISISPGFYSSKGLYKTINASTTAISMSMFENEGKFILYKDSPFGIIFNSNEFTNATGFVTGSFTSSLATTSNGIFDTSVIGKYFVKSSNVMNLKTFGEYLFLDIDELRRPIEFEAVSNPYTSDNSSPFAIIPLDVPSGSIKTFKEESDFKMSVKYPKPIDQIDRFTVRWLDSLGNSVNFNGVDENSILLRCHFSNSTPVSDINILQMQTKKKIDPMHNIFLFMIVVFIIILFLKRK